MLTVGTFKPFPDLPPETDSEDEGEEGSEKIAKKKEDVDGDGPKLIDWTRPPGESKLGCGGAYALTACFPPRVTRLLLVL